MAEGATIANAFVQIMPSMEGATDNITNAILPSMTSAGDKAGASFMGGFGGKFGTMMKGLGVAALGYLAVDKLVDAFTEVEAGFNNVVIATGATGQAAEELRDVYTQVAGSVVGSFEDIGSAVGELNTRLGLNGEELEAASEQAMKYAKVNGVDATAAIQDVTRMMNNAGISADDYAHVLDVLTVAAQQSGIDVSKLATTVTENAASFRELGFSTEESIAMLAQFEKAGVNSSQVLAGMKKGVAEWAKEGKSAQEGFAEFVQGVQDGSVTSADAIELFGSRAGMAMYDAAAQGQLNWDDMFTAITTGSEGALDEVYFNTLTAQEKLDVLGKKVEAGFYELVEPIVDAVAPYMDDIIAAVAGAVDFIVDVAGPYIARAIRNVGAIVSWLVDTFGPAFNDICNFVDGASSAFQGFADTANGVFNEIAAIPGNIVAWFSGLGSRITSAIGSIHFPTPHVSWTYLDIAGVQTVPLPSVAWYAKGGIVDEATLIGAGEAGPEAIVPLNAQGVKPIADAVGDELGSELAALRDEIRNLKLVLNIDGRSFAEATVGEMDRALGTMNRRAYAR